MRKIKDLIIESGLLKTYNSLVLELERIFFSNRFDFRLKQHPPLLIYQMGKVASASVYQSLRRLYPGVVLHTHTFSKNDRNWKVRKVYEHSVVNKESLKVITLTREPIGRNISAFFQNFKRTTGVSYRKAKFSIDELQKIFLEKFNHDIPLDWFDKNIKLNFGIDVYSSPFPSLGVAIYENRNIHILILRSELDDKEKSDAIKQFLGLTDFKLISKNVGAKKIYADTYQLFKQKVRLPQSYISRMCNSRYFNHFYSKEFVDQIKNKWSREE